MGMFLKARLLATIVLILAVSTASVNAYPSDEYTLKNGEYYDDWGYNRNYCCDSNGYMPNLAYETIGQNSELAYSIGQQFLENYPSENQRAVAILKYIQRWTEYGYDEDNVFMNGKAQVEWAWNADETAHAFDEETNTVAIGDCEDMAFLGATIYMGAGFDTALVLTDSHVALLIWLPEYPNANVYWDILDGRGEGWIWVEATGGSNPLGWTPPDFNDGYWDAYPLNTLISSVDYSPDNPEKDEDVTVTATIALESDQINKVVLSYSVNGGSTRTVQMARSGSAYRGTIPGQSTGTTVEFQIKVTDTDGYVTESGVYSYDVGGLEIPGFPFESIIVGLGVGIIALYFMSKKAPLLTPKVP